MVKEFREKGYRLDGKVETPAGNDLFSPSTGELLRDGKNDDFQMFVAKGLFASKQGRPDLQPTIAVLLVRVKVPTKSDWKKLMQLMKYLKGTSKMSLTISAKELHTMQWFVDVATLSIPILKATQVGL